jgi:hypothetical protein
MINTGASKKKVEIKKDTFPNTAKDAIAVSATHEGVAWEDPMPTWCHDSKYARHKSVAPDGDVGKAPPTSAPKRFLELIIEIIARVKKPKTSGRFKSDNQLRVFTGVNKSSSSSESRIDLVEELSSGNTLLRTSSTRRSAPNRI